MGQKEMEDTQLYKLLTSGTENSLKRAWNIVDGLTETDVKLRSEADRSSYLHVLINNSRRIYERHGQSYSALIPFIYKLALRGVNMNAQNVHGNTCLHLACLKPNTEQLCEHLIRIGVDPCIMNKNGCRVIHTIQNHKCSFVKGQARAKSGIWSAVEREDLTLTERLLRSWCRVNIRKNKSLLDVADETGNIHLIKLLHKYEMTNEMVCAAFAGDLVAVKEFVKSGVVNPNTSDISHEPARPLCVALEACRSHTSSIVDYLIDVGSGPRDYHDEVTKRQTAFTNSEFYRKVEECTEESLTEALDLVKNLDVTLRMTEPHKEGWTVVHYLVDKYNQIVSGDEYLSRVLIRVLYRVAMHGAPMNKRDAKGRTPLMLSADKLDQAIMTHVLRLGGDPSITESNGKAVNEEVYEDKGKLVYDNKYRQADLPGLWVAVYNNNKSRAERALKSCHRVNIKKGDRRLIDLAKDMERWDIVKMLEISEHVNEFVCATLSCDLKLMMHLLALGKGHEKVNTIDDFFHVGFTWDRHAEFIPRPIVISAMEICGPEVLDFLLQYGADLSKAHEESYPCGPAMFWAFREHVDNRNTLVVAKHADVSLQDELGCSMLHKIMQKKQREGKQEIIQVLLDRGINIAARDYEGATARDYISIFNVEDEEELTQIIDNHVLELISNDKVYEVENLIVENYDHILDIRSTKKNKSPMEIAEVKELKDMVALLKELREYKQNIEILHTACREGDLRTISKLSGEKRCAWSKDRAGRTLLHNAVLWNHPDIVTFLVEQHNVLINSIDNLLRTPLHYCVCLSDRENIWPILQDGGADPNIVDVNNFSVYDYVRELETPTPVTEKPRGRRVRNYQPSELITSERKLKYGNKMVASRLFYALKDNIGSMAISDIEQIIGNFSGTLDIYDYDAILLKSAVENWRTEVVKILIEKCGARKDVQIQVKGKKSQRLMDYALEHSMTNLVEYLRDGVSREEKQEETKQDNVPETMIEIEDNHSMD